MLICSHIMCKVANIAEAVRDYQQLGFSVAWGSAPERAHNAFIWFEEGPFLELFQIPESWWPFGTPLGLIFGRAAGKRWYRWFGSAEGLCDLALVPPVPGKAVEQELLRDMYNFRLVKLSLRKAGVPVSRTIHGWRVRPDGLKVKYSFFSPEPSGLPFVVSGYDSLQRPGNILHANGACNIKWIKMGVAQDDWRQFERLTGGDPWLTPQPASATRLLEVGIAGITGRLDAQLLHGVVLTGADPNGQYVDR